MQLLQAALSGSYLIDREVGCGSMSTVYQAEDRKHHRPVAIKVLQPELTTTLAEQRFLQEIRIAAVLNHPNILPLYDSGVSEGFYYYVMPYVSGQSLRDYIKQSNPLSLEEAFHIVRDIADGLDYAHKQGIVHRDIKPENVLLEEGHAVIMDFGIARAMKAAESDKITRTGWILGTPAYMSPEQAYGHQDIDNRSDLYSLGCVLFEMLTGRPPFTGPNAQVVIMNMFTQDVPPIRTLRPEVPMPVAMAIRKALAKSPTERFATVTDFVQALESDTIAPFQSGKKSIAVLPFTDMSRDQENEYLADGLTEEIINALSQVENLNVVSRTSVYALRGKNLDIRSIGEQLNAFSVLEGTVRRAGNRLRVTVQLIDVTNGYQLWSERFDREMKDVFDIQDEIARNIVRTLRVILRENEQGTLVRRSSVDVRAYEYYLRGRQFFHQTRKKSLEFARQMFTRATEIASGYALAHAGIADSCSLISMYYPGNEAELTLADDASRLALELDPELPEAQEARGFALWQLGKHAEAEQHFQEALRLSPRLFEAWYFYARLCFQQGRLEEARDKFEQAAAVRDDYQASFFAAQASAALGQMREAESAYRRALQVVTKHMELNPDDPRAATVRAVAACRVGQQEEGLRWAEQALALDVEDASVRYNVVCLYALEGLQEKALDCLEAAFKAGFGNREWIRRDPDLASLRDHPRFRELMEEP